MLSGKMGNKRRNKRVEGVEEVLLQGSCCLKAGWASACLRDVVSSCLFIMWGFVGFYAFFPALIKLSLSLPMSFLALVLPVVSPVPL